MLRESELDAQFETVFADLVRNEEKQENLSKNIKNMALPDATKHIVDEIEKLLK